MELIYLQMEDQPVDTHTSLEDQIFKYVVGL